MRDYPAPLDLAKVKVLPLAERKSLSSLHKILVRPEQAPPECDAATRAVLEECSQKIKAARQAGASVLLMYGAHLVKNGALALVNELLDLDCLSHLATNGAGSIHDWELAFLCKTEESVRENVATGTFGTWDETGRWINLAVLAGGLRPEGYGASLGRFIEEGLHLPAPALLEDQLRSEPSHPLSPARAELLRIMLAHDLRAGHVALPHRWKATSILAHAFRRRVPLTVHPGIGYDIIANHPMFSGAALGRAAELDFRLLARAVEGLDDGVVLSVGSAIMAPQVFEKSLSCVNNLRLQAGRRIVRGHAIYVVDLQPGSAWDWSRGEPPKDNPAYYLRFCKSFARMGGSMRYVQCDNVAFLHNLLWILRDGRT